MSGILIIICAIVIFMLGLVAGVMLERLNKLPWKKPNKLRSELLDLERAEAEIEHCEHQENGLRCDMCEYEPICNHQAPDSWTGALGGF